ncbi:RDD family protein [Streptomyces sp. H27-D2]|uniref:RDD family protein n=1 Tax=Streptomyces sp. H27-D2 TaxID=3046304 RepID=UPI002DBF1758|nr:RDD family protein [Streptomyces sp. H27-D2]MEC4015122.1 RDD family protein [Streptomyces sp. H27-D2]
MSNDQPPPGSGQPPDDDPFRKGPQEPPPSGSPYGNRPPPPPTPPPSYGSGPYGDSADAGPPYGNPPPGGSPYGDAPYGDPYGGQSGADPLSGMPPLANRFRRLIARIIDGLLIGIPVSAIVTLAVGGIDPTEDTGRSTSLSVIVSLVYFVYEGLMLTSRGQTVGKKLMKIRVAMLDNGAIPAGQPGWYRAGTYALPQIVPCCGTIFWFINVLWCTWDKPYQQCLHDKVAKTVVVAAD